MKSSPCLFVLVLVPIVPVSEAGSNASNMNGDYILSQTPKGHDTQTKFPTHYRDYPLGADYFDIYSPLITSLYSQVFW